jgi:myosin-5
VSRLEEWCTGHGIAEATLHLQQLLQAAKFLTLNKTSSNDIETIFDVCFLLNPTQIKKLLSLYHAADFDSPVRFLSFLFTIYFSCLLIYYK